MLYSNFLKPVSNVVQQSTAMAIPQIIIKTFWRCKEYLSI